MSPCTLDFIGAKDDGGGGGAIRRAKLHSNHHRQQTKPNILQAGCPCCRPTNSVKAWREKFASFNVKEFYQRHILMWLMTSLWGGMGADNLRLPNLIPLYNNGLLSLSILTNISRGEPGLAYTAMCLCNCFSALISHKWHSQNASFFMKR